MNDKQSLAQKFEEKIAQNQSENLSFENSLGAPIRVQPVMQVEVPAGDPRVIKARHEQSVKTYPDITVDEDEYVVLSMRRHSLGYLLNIIFSAFIGVLLISAWIIICFMPNPLSIPANFKPQISLIFGSITLLLIILTYVNYIVYRANRFVITNERAVQWISNTIMSQKKQVINLESIEDISYSRDGILQHLFDYGTVKLSTVGDESTYTFPFSPNPDKKAEFLSDIVEAARENQMLSDELFEEGVKMSVK
ncbi:MAG: PH domain-containing protein [Candidatus Nanogingivalis sp.]